MLHTQWMFFLFFFLMDLACHKDQRDCFSNICLANILRFVIVIAKFRWRTWIMFWLQSIGFFEKLLLRSQAFKAWFKLVDRTTTYRRKKPKRSFCSVSFSLFRSSSVVFMLGIFTTSSHNVLLVSAGRCVCNFSKIWLLVLLCGCYTVRSTLVKRI